MTSPKIGREIFQQFTFQDYLKRNQLDDERRQKEILAFFDKKIEYIFQLISINTQGRIERTLQNLENGWEKAFFGEVDSGIDHLDFDYKSLDRNVLEYYLNNSYLKRHTARNRRAEDGKFWGKAVNFVEEAFMKDKPFETMTMPPFLQEKSEQYSGAKAIMDFIRMKMLLATPDIIGGDMAHFADMAQRLLKEQLDLDIQFNIGQDQKNRMFVDFWMEHLMNFPNKDEWEAMHGQTVVDTLDIVQKIDPNADTKALRDIFFDKEGYMTTKTSPVIEDTGQYDELLKKKSVTQAAPNPYDALFD